ncbi:hypothetical protein HKX42_02690 [Salinisphaera sp. USBA-960]|uniref:hypothetical protein n=1 Tax=Salinisphaera orenii TaxID=856731 RepID=UPI000DBE7C26|nr:hypothetical protein [Salifodinibacter halophilus]NNC25783.1 hypothetical protein [Salifodinibacter halophilus]
MRNDIKAVIAGIGAAATLLQLAAWLIARQHWAPFAPLALAEPALWRVPLVALECVSGAVAGPIAWRLIRNSEAAGYYMASMILAALAAVAIVGVVTWAHGGSPAQGWLIRCEAAALAGGFWGFGFALYMHGLRRLP